MVHARMWKLLTRPLMKIRLWLLYRLRVAHLTVSPRAVHIGETLLISGRIASRSVRLATGYVIIRIRHALRPEVLIFDSHADLDYRQRNLLRRYDILPNSEAGFAMSWRIPESVEAGVYHVRAELWTPSKGNNILA